MIALRGDGPAPAPWADLTFKQLYERHATPHAWFPALFKQARGLGVEPFASVFGLESLALLESLECSRYKIAKMDNVTKWLVQAAKDTKKPVYLSVDERRAGVDRNVHWLWCPGEYPAKPEQMGLKRLRLLRFAGLSCHSRDPRIAPLAVAAGCRSLEYHLMLAGTEPLDAAFSLDEKEFAAMAQRVKETEVMLG